MRIPGHTRVALLLILTVLVISIVMCGVVLAEEKKSSGRIILISVDGLNYEGYASFAKDSLRYLAMDGASTDRCLAVRADTVEAGEASLLTGCLPEEHTHYTKSDKVGAESIMDVFNNAGRSVLVVDGSGGKLGGFSRGYKEYVKVKSSASDSEVMKKATDLLLDRRPYFTYIYLNDCRTSIMGASSKDYYNTMRILDLEIGKLQKALKNQSIYDSTTIVVTASRSTSQTDMVPLLIKGPGVKQNVSINGVCVVDVAPTICVLAGLDKPLSSSGLVLWNAFTKEKTEGNELIINRVEELQRERLKVWKKFYDMVRERDKYSHQIEEIKEERESIFNFAGEKERTIAELKGNLGRGKSMIAGLSLVFLLGYLVEYRLLKKKFLLFK